MVTGDAIFLLDGDKPKPLRETPYEKEVILQKVLKDYPNLIAGVATAGDKGRLLLVRREMPVPGPSGASQLSLDHLFIDNRAIPVLVEVKRSSNTLARREVVAQMLDYAANGVAYWPPEQLRANILAQAGQKRLDEASFLREVLDVGGEPDAFWRLVEDNLRAGRVRLIFLADRLPAGLVRIIEFLNEQMQDTEVLGIELPQYTGSGDAIVYVPRVVGQTAAAIRTKVGTGSGTRWTKEGLLAAAEQGCTDSEQAFIQMLIRHREARSGRFTWGSGLSPGITGWYFVEGQETPVWNINIGTGSGKGNFYFIFGEYASRQTPSLVQLYADAVSSIPAAADRMATVQSSGWKGWVGLPLEQAVAVGDDIVKCVNAALSST